MPFLADKIKPQMRISATQTAFDTELEDLVTAARNDLRLSGVLALKANSETDALITRAVSLYVKANFGWDNPDALKFQSSYDSLKAHLTLSQEYTMLTVTFTVTSASVPLPDAVVTFNGQEKITNFLGVAVFIGLRETQNMEYAVKLEGYADASGEIDVDAAASVSVSMVVI